MSTQKNNTLDWFFEEEKEYWERMRAREEPYRNYIRNHADDLRDIDKEMPRLRWILRQYIREPLYRAFLESGGWEALSTANACTPVFAMLDRECRNPEDKGSTRTTYRKYLDNSLDGLRRRIAETVARAMIRRAIQTGDHPEWADADDEDLLSMGNIPEYTWHILKGSHSRTAFVLSDVDAALHFALCDDMPFLALMLETKKSKSAGTANKATSLNP